MSWSLDAHDLDLLAVQADERLLTTIGARRHAEGADPAIAVLTALVREVDARPIPTERPAGLTLVGQPADAGRRAKGRVALTGVAAAVAVLSIGGVAAAVGGAPVSSVIRDTVESVFSRNSGPSTADLVGAKLGDANAALARGDAQRAKEILDDIKAQVEKSDPSELPPSLVEQVKKLESLVDPVEAPLPAPADAASTSPHGPAGTNGGEASQVADSETDGTEEAEDDETDQGQGQEEQDDEAIPTSEPTSAPEPSDPAEHSPTPSAEPTPSPSDDADPTPSPTNDAEDDAPHEASQEEDSPESAPGVGGPDCHCVGEDAEWEQPAGWLGHHEGAQQPTTDEAESYEPAEQPAPTAP